jgi:uncharacterized protein (DUF2267 family)
VADALVFAGALPPVLRAMFVADWDAKAAVLPFADRAALTAEVRALRADHNFAPDTVIADVVACVRIVADPVAFAAALARLPAPAVEFWSDPDRT